MGESHIDPNCVLGWVFLNRKLSLESIIVSINLAYQQCRDGNVLFRGLWAPV
jgi:hypothetical protein